MEINNFSLRQLEGKNAGKVGVLQVFEAKFQIKTAMLLTVGPAYKFDMDILTEMRDKLLDFGSYRKLVKPYDGSAADMQWKKGFVPLHLHPAPVNVWVGFDAPC